MQRQRWSARMTVTNMEIGKYREKGQKGLSYMHIHYEMTMNLQSTQTRSMCEWIKTMPNHCAYFETAVGHSLEILRARDLEEQEKIQAKIKYLTPSNIQMTLWTKICSAENGTKCRKQCGCKDVRKQTWK